MLNFAMIVIKLWNKKFLFSYKELTTNFLEWQINSQQTFHQDANSQHFQ